MIRNCLFFFKPSDLGVFRRSLVMCLNCIQMTLEPCLCVVERWITCNGLYVSPKLALMETFLMGFCHWKPKVCCSILYVWEFPGEAGVYQVSIKKKVTSHLVPGLHRKGEIFKREPIPERHANQYGERGFPSADVKQLHSQCSSRQL